MSDKDSGFKAALEEAQKGASEGGIPIGACLVSADGKILGRGHNMRIQKDSATIHVSKVKAQLSFCFARDESTTCVYAKTNKAEIAALEDAGRLPASSYKGATMYTTLSPCDMCTGACILYKIGGVVLGENKTFVGGEELLKARGIEVVNLNNAECEQLMQTFIKQHPEDWWVLMRG